MVATNPYKVLGISTTASVEEAVKAYKKLAKEYHPDRPEGDEEKFKEINEAIDQIKNPPKPAPSHNYSGNFANFQDIFSQYDQSIFENAQFKKPTRRIQYNISLEEAFKGFVLGDSIVSAGIKEGSRVAAPQTQYESDIEYTFIYKPHSRFKVENNNLLMQVDIPHLQCILGGSTEILTICGKKLKVTIPKLSSGHTSLKLAGYGMNTKRNKMRGDLFVQINPIFPKRLTPEEEDLYRRIDALSS